MQAPANDSLIGQIIDQRYRILEKIGVGLNGNLYRAEDLERKFPVALKFLNYNVADEKAKERFQRGAETASSLAHPNIVRLYSFEISPQGKPYIVMDVVQGNNLAETLKSIGPLAEDLCISMFTQVSDALEHAHGKGVVHRNLKPSNIMLISAPGGSCMVKVADFGVAKAAGEKETRQSLAKKGEMLGNPAYMSPEQCTGQKIDGRSDIYAAGCLLFECLTGKQPFTGGNSFDVMNKHVNDEIPDIVALRPDLKNGAHLAVIVKRALAKKPNDRYQSAGEMSHDLNLLNEVESDEWEARAVAMKPPVIIVKPEDTNPKPLITFEMLKPVLIGSAALLVLLLVAGTSMLVIAFTDADVPPLLKYKIAVQEMVLAPTDGRLLKNCTAMSEYYKAEHRYAEAWVYKDKVLKATAPPKEDQ